MVAVVVALETVTLSIVIQVALAVLVVVALVALAPLTLTLLEMREVALQAPLILAVEVALAVVDGEIPVMVFLALVGQES
jgi:hypothetical protein